MCPAHVYWFVYIFITMCMKHQSLFIGYEVVRLTQSVFLWKILECLVVGGKKWPVCVFRVRVKESILAVVSNDACWN